MKLFKQLVLSILSIIVLLIISLGLDIYTYPRGLVREDADAAIVLGAAIWTDRPSPVFRERLNHGLHLYRAGKVKKIIVTGGYGEGEKFSEAEIGEKYLLENGVEPTDICKETKSKTTYQNLENSVPVVADNNIGPVLIVSDPLHLRRAVLMARKQGLDAYPAATPTTRYQSFSSQFKFLAREVYFYGRYLIWGS
jgi:uncharacterized SAM-binding protein YcdF (DUF218 family)